MFNENFLKCTNHEVPYNMILQIFCRSLDHLNKTVVDNAAGGSLIRLSYGAPFTFLEQITNQNRGWYTQNIEVCQSYPST